MDIIIIIYKESIMCVPTGFVSNDLKNPTLVGSGKIVNGAIILTIHGGSFVFTKDYGFVPYI